MYKRLKKEFSIDTKLIRGSVDLNYVKKLAPFEFQNWVVVDKFYGNISKTKSGDMGIDGITAPLKGGYPIQVKQSEGVGRPVVQQFESAIRYAKKKRGYIVAYSFSKQAREAVAEIKSKGEIEIILRTAQELLDGKVAEDNQRLREQMQ